MKRKAVILVLTACIILAFAQIGFTAMEENRTRLREDCQEPCVNLTPEEREQVEAARDEFREQMEALHEEFQMRKDALRGEFLEKLPADVRVEIEGKMSTRKERHNSRMGARGGFTR